MEPSLPDVKLITRYCNLLFALSLLVAVIYILSLPVFPTGDGPLHLYNAHILWSLATHRPEYQRFYAIRHLVGIYSIHYFALILFGHFLTPAKAEELFIAMIVVSNALGFRFLASRLGKNAAVASLWMIPLLLTWPLAGGFLNYCFASGILFWALGCWISLSSTGSIMAFSGFIATQLTLVLSHPVPLAFLLVFMTADIGLLWSEERRFQNGGRFSNRGLRVSAFCITCVALVVPALLIKNSTVVSTLHWIYPHPELFTRLLSGRYIGMFGGHYLLFFLYTLTLLEIVPIVILMRAEETRVHFCSGTTTSADRMLIFSVVFLAATLCFPPVVNGAHYFPERFWSVLWPLILACSVGASLSVRALRGVSIAGTLAILLTGAVAFSALAPAARMQAEIAQVRIPAGSRGVFVEPISMTDNYALGFTYAVFYWCGARTVDRSHAVLLNSPWVDQPQIPIVQRAGAGMFSDNLYAYDLEHPFSLAEKISAPSPERDTVLKSSDFILYADPVNGSRDLSASIRAILRDQQQLWSCRYGSYFALCEKH
jgi:hypothetical protein